MVWYLSVPGGARNPPRSRAGGPLPKAGLERLRGRGPQGTVGGHGGRSCLEGLPVSWASSQDEVFASSKAAGDGGGWELGGAGWPM